MTPAPVPSSPITPKIPMPWLKPPVIVKVGGSLYSWPELKPRLREYLATWDGSMVLLVPGGGATANVIRDLDQIHHLGEETSHWLALHALTLNAHWLAGLLGVQVVEGLNAARSAWRRGGVTVLDVYRFARGDESRPDHPPHCWSVTSDSMAARVAAVAEAERLVLLKSTEGPGDWTEASQAGYVDPFFPSLIPGASFTTEAINLRAWVRK